MVSGHKRGSTPLRRRRSGERQTAAVRPVEVTAEGVDIGQIREMLRLTPTQRLRKAWRYSRLAMEIQRAAGLRTREAAGRPEDKAVLPVRRGLLSPRGKGTQ